MDVDAEDDEDLSEDANTEELEAEVFGHYRS